MSEETLGKVIAATAQRLERILDVLEPWVRMNSYSANVAGVNRMGELLARDFELPGLELRRHPGGDVGDHLAWMTPAWSAGPADQRVVLIGHHDTVFPPGSFETWDLDGDRLSGPGVLDMKGGLATVWAALGGLADAGMLHDVPLALVSVGDEEIGSQHSRPWLEKIAKGAGAGLVFEAGRQEDRIITRRKGTGGIKVHAAGKSAHAGNHHRDGVNAIWSICRFVEAAQGLTNYDRGVTVNVGLIHGGEARNTVPGHAECSVDFRFEDINAGHEVVAELEAAARSTGADTGCVVTVDGGIRRLPLERSEASAALCAEYAQCASASGLSNQESPLLGGGSDANTVSAIGVPAIDGLGPRGRGFHTHSEFIEVSSLPLKAQALVRFLVGRVSNS